MKKIEIVTLIKEYENTEDFTEKEQQLIEAADQASQSAYAPYSEFKVGAAVLLENGVIVKGNNQENAAYPSGLCAERVAIFYANANYPDVPVIAIAITAYKNGKISKNTVAPCGACRQVLLETELRFNKPIKVFLVSESKIKVLDNIKSLLPIYFS